MSKHPVEDDAETSAAKAARTENDEHGFVAPGWDGVRAAFEQNLAEDGLEVGAACAIYHRGKLVASLYGGSTDAERKTAWREGVLISTTRSFCLRRRALELTLISVPVGATKIHWC